MGGENRYAKDSRKQAAAATATTQAGRETYLNSPEFAAIQQLAAQITANPFTYGPNEIDRIYSQGAGEGYAASKGMLDNLYNRAGVAGGFRSGSTRAGEYEIGARLGESLAGARRQGELTAAQQRIPDLTNALQLNQNLAQNRFSLDQAVANAQLGAGSLLSGLQNAQSPAGQAASGFGGILGNVLTAGTSPKGLFKGT